jgi:hypothetical protein
MLYVQPEEQVPASILDSSVATYADTTSEIFQSLDLKGSPVILPPRYFENPEETGVFVPREKDGPLPLTERKQQDGEHEPASDSSGIIITPSGADLAQLFEKALKVSFTTTNLDFLRHRLPSLLIEDLELVEEFEIQAEPQTDKTSNSNSQDLTSGSVTVKIATTAWPNSIKKAEKHPNLALVDNPLISALAIALAKATGKPVSLKSIKANPAGTSVSLQYSIEQEPVKP